MKRIALATLAVALASVLGHSDPAAAGPRCGFHRHYVRGHYQYFHGHRRYVSGHCV